MKTATPSAITRLMAQPKTLALLLSILATSAWLGAVIGSFEAAAQAQMPQTQMAQAQLPQAQLPQAQLPLAQLPLAELPQAQLPLAQLPQIQLPSVTVVAKAAPLLANLSASSLGGAAAAAGSKL